MGGMMMVTRRYLLCLLLACSLFGQTSAYNWRAFAQNYIEAPEGQVSQLMFSPEDPIERMLCSLIANEVEKVQLMQFMVTNKKISDALVRKAGQGVSVELIIDGGNFDCPFSKVSYLRNNGITVHNHERVQTPFYQKLMHEKVIIFHNNMALPGGGSLVLFGSCNLTSSACRHNRENLYISNEAALVSRFIERFATAVTICESMLACRV